MKIALSSPAKHCSSQSVLNVVSTAMVGILIGCGDITAPGGGGANHETRSCQQNYNSSAWSANGILLSVASPPCPYIVRTSGSIFGREITYTALVKVPKANIDNYPFDIGFVDAYAWSTYVTFGFIGEAHQFLFADPNNSSLLKGEPTFTGYPQEYPHPSDPTITRDSLRLEIGGVKQGYPQRAWAVKILPGRIDGVPQSVSGPTNVKAANGATWQAVPSWDTTAYAFGWQIDGQAVSGAQGARLTHAFSAGGTRQIRNITIRADRTADTVAKTVNVAPPMPQVQTVNRSANGYAYLAWSASAGADSYRFYRRLDTQTSWDLWRTLGTLSFEDYPTEVVSYYGTSQPSTGTKWVGYKVVAVYNGYESDAWSTHYFLLDPSGPEAPYLWTPPVMSKHPQS